MWCSLSIVACIHNMCIILSSSFRFLEKSLAALPWQFILVCISAICQAGLTPQMRHSFFWMDFSYFSIWVRHELLFFTIRSIRSQLVFFVVEMRSLWGQCCCTTPTEKPVAHGCIFATCNPVSLCGAAVGPASLSLSSPSSFPNSSLSKATRKLFPKPILKQILKQFLKLPLSRNPVKIIILRVPR